MKIDNKFQIGQRVYVQYIEGSKLLIDAVEIRGILVQSSSVKYILKSSPVTMVFDEIELHASIGEANSAILNSVVFKDYVEDKKKDDHDE